MSGAEEIVVPWIRYMIPGDDFKQFTLGKIIASFFIVFRIHQLRFVRVVFLRSNPIFQPPVELFFSVRTLTKWIIINARNMCEVVCVLVQNVLQRLVQMFAHLSRIFAGEGATSQAWYCNQSKDSIFLNCFICVVEKRCQSSRY
uniref:Uncharacterized protein n=1 Tax=Cacopsylla melanoneura TaxID=428564 RepID=A0A8D8SQ81_9HEMI